MNTNDATKQAYQNGYEAGYAIGYKVARDKIVHCKDCKYYQPGKELTDIRFCQRLPYYREKGGLNVSDNDFCSYGERKGKHD